MCVALLVARSIALRLDGGHSRALQWGPPAGDDPPAWLGDGKGRACALPSLGGVRDARRIWAGLVSRRTVFDVDQALVQVCVSKYVYVCVCLCTVSEAGLIAGASSSHGPSGISEAAEVAVLEGPSRPIGGAGQGITAEVFPAPARPIRLGAVS